MELFFGRFPRLTKRYVYRLILIQYLHQEIAPIFCPIVPHHTKTHPPKKMRFRFYGSDEITVLSHHFSPLYHIGVPEQHFNCVNQDANSRASRVREPKLVGIWNHRTRPGTKTMFLVVLNPEASFSYFENLMPEIDDGCTTPQFYYLESWLEDGHLYAVTFALNIVALQMRSFQLQGCARLIIQPYQPAAT